MTITTPLWRHRHADSEPYGHHFPDLIEIESAAASEGGGLATVNPCPHDERRAEVRAPAELVEDDYTRLPRCCEDGKPIGHAQPHEVVALVEQVPGPVKIACAVCGETLRLSGVSAVRA